MINELNLCRILIETTLRLILSDDLILQGDRLNSQPKNLIEIKIWFSDRMCNPLRTAFKVIALGS